jgi:hypothetical protein
MVSASIRERSRRRELANKKNTRGTRMLHDFSVITEKGVTTSAD